MKHDFFSYFTYYRKIAGKKFYLFIVLAFFASLLDGLGVSALLPLISLDFEGSEKRDTMSELFFSFFSYCDIDPTVKAVLLTIFIIFLFKLIFTFTQLGVSSYISSWLVEYLKRKYSIAYNKMKYDYYVRTNIGYFNNIITTETGHVVTGFKKLSDVCIFILNIFAYLSFSFILNWRLTTGIIIASLVLHISYKKIRSRVATISYIKTEVNAKSQNVLIQYINNYKYLKATSNSKSYLKHLFPLLYKGRMLDFKNQIYNNFTTTTFEFFRVSLLLAAIYYMVEVRGEKVATIFVPLALIARSFGMALNMQVKWQGFISVTGSIKALQEAWEKLTSHVEHSGDCEVSKFSKKIQLIDVSYAYKVKKVLKNISLDIERGKCIGVAGSSGSGKTTLIDLITGLLEPTTGNIKLDGTDYSSIEKDNLRSYFGYVTQEPIIFNDSIRNNISFWDQYPDVEEKIDRAITIAGCSEFISELEEGIDTIVGDKGIQLSGGQRQRISIAREIYLDSEIMIFDEATASLDSKIEKYVQDSIEKLLGSKTIIIIAHRLSTLKICDEILVLKDGEIIEKGSWEELLKRNKAFSKMCKRQGVS